LTQILVVAIFAAAKIISDPTLGTLQLIENLNSAEGLVLTLSVFASAIVGVGLIIVIVKVRKSVTIAEYLSLRKITRKTVLALLALSAGIIILSDCLSLILGRPIIAEYMVNAYSTIAWPALLWVAVAFFAPAFEETFFRGFLFVGLRQSRIGIAGTIVLTALIWTLFHIQYGVYGMATIFVLGIVLGIARHKTESLWSPLLMHVFVNSVAMLQLALIM